MNIKNIWVATTLGISFGFSFKKKIQEAVYELENFCLDSAVAQPGTIFTNGAGSMESNAEVKKSHKGPPNFLEAEFHKIWDEKPMEKTSKKPMEKIAVWMEGHLKNQVIYVPIKTSINM